MGPRPEGLRRAMFGTITPVKTSLQSLTTMRNDRPETPTRGGQPKREGAGARAIPEAPFFVAVLLGLGLGMIYIALQLINQSNDRYASSASPLQSFDDTDGIIPAGGDQGVLMGIGGAPAAAASALVPGGIAADGEGQEQDDSAPAPFLCSITRVHNEHVKFKSFIEHQLREGFDIVMFLDDRSKPPHYSAEPRVRIRQVDFSILEEMNRKAGRIVINPYGLSFVKDYVKAELMSCTWIAYVDVDELVTTRRNERRTVRDELASTFADVDSVHVPWIFYGNDLATSPPVYNDVALEILWRFNHSLHHEGYDRKTRDRYSEIEMKAIFRPDRCSMESDHTVKCPRQVDSVYKKPAKNLGSRYNFFHEQEVQDAYLAINHYRFIDKEDIRNKCSAATAFVEYKIGNCFSVMIKSNKPEIYDNIMLRKFFYRRDSGIARPMVAPATQDAIGGAAGDAEGEEGDDDTARAAAPAAAGRTARDAGAGGSDECILNIHGFHTSGGEVVQDIIKEMFADAATKHDFRNPEDPFSQGQHSQTVYRSFKHRTLAWCMFDGIPAVGMKAYDLMYTCEGQMKIVSPRTSRRLLQDWKRGWDNSFPIKLQHTPTYDVIFLDLMIQSSQILVMRHPYTYFNNLRLRGKDPLFAIDVWVRVWNRLLGHLRNGMVERWIILQYESRDNTDHLREWTREVCRKALDGHEQDRPVRAADGAAEAEEDAGDGDGADAASDGDDEAEEAEGEAEGEAGGEGGAAAERRRTMAADAAREEAEEEAEEGDERGWQDEDVITPTLHAVHEIWQDVLTRWFGYSLRYEAVLEEAKSMSMTWSSHLEPGKVEIGAFWKEWDRAFAEHEKLMSQSTLP